MNTTTPDIPDTSIDTPAADTALVARWWAGKRVLAAGVVGVCVLAAGGGYAYHTHTTGQSVKAYETAWEKYSTARTSLDTLVADADTFNTTCLEDVADNTQPCTDLASVLTEAKALNTLTKLATGDAGKNELVEAAEAATTGASSVGEATTKLQTALDTARAAAQSAADALRNADLATWIQNSQALISQYRSEIDAAAGRVDDDAIRQTAAQKLAALENYVNEVNSKLSTVSYGEGRKMIESFNQLTNDVNSAIMGMRDAVANHDQQAAAAQAAQTAVASSRTAAATAGVRGTTSTRTSNNSSAARSANGSSRQTTTTPSRSTNTGKTGNAGSSTPARNNGGWVDTGDVWGEGGSVCGDTKGNSWNC